MVVFTVVFLCSCNKEFNLVTDSLGDPTGSYAARDPQMFKHESVAKILSLVLKNQGGQEIYLDALDDFITMQTDTTIAGLYSIPIAFLLNRTSKGNVKFHTIWDVFAQQIDTSCNSRYLMQQYFPAYPSMGMMIFDPADGKEKYFTTLPTNFQLAYSLDNSEDSISVFQDGTNLGKIGFEHDPTVMTVVVQENEGYWMLLPHQIANSEAFFDATGIDLCEDAILQLPGLDQNILGGSSTIGGSSISLGLLTYSNPLSDYILLLRSDVQHLHNTLCHLPDINSGITLRNGDDCDRDLWDNPGMNERIIRFRVPNQSASELLITKTRCNFGNKNCTFLIIAYIPRYDGDLSDPSKSFYGRGIPKLYIVKRKRLDDLNWLWEFNMDFGPWLYNQGRMGDFWLYDVIQKNRDEGKEVTQSVNSKFINSVKFLISGPIITGIALTIESNRSVEATVGQTVKWTEKDWPLGTIPVFYCDCQSCNGWQGKEYSTGVLNFSIRECSFLPWCPYPF